MSKRVYISRYGPFDYDDTSLVNDADGLFPGQVREALITDGQLYVEEAPVLDEHVVRLTDLNTAIAGVGGGGGSLSVDSSESITLSGGVATASGTSNNLVLDTEGGAASDDLTAISGISENKVIVLRAAATGRTIVVKSNTNLILGSDFRLDANGDTIMLLCVGNNQFLQLSRSNNGNYIVPVPDYGITFEDTTVVWEDTEVAFEDRT